MSKTYRERMAINMANPLYNEQMQKGFQSQFGSFMSNPMGFLMQHRINIPQQYANNPRDAVQYLLNNGQMSQDQLNSIMQKAQQMGYKF